jgi:carboxypeptidase T
MKPSKNILILSFLVSLLHLQAGGQEKYSTVKIFAPAEKTLRAQLIGLLQIDHFQEAGDGAIVVEIGEAEMARLKSTSYPYRVLVDNIAMNLEMVNRQYYAERANGAPAQHRVAIEQSGRTVDDIITTPSAFTVQPTFGGYYSFAQMEAAMDDLVNDFPLLAQKVSLGLSHENRNIWCIKISDQVTTDETNEPEVLFIGIQHAREAIGGSSMIFLMQYLCERYSTNTSIKDLVDNREIFIVPCLNPDGWEYNRNNGGVGSGWRKNRRNNGDGSRGVDLNRNWSVDWSNCSSPIIGSPTSCGSSDPDDDTYYGPSAFSEPETRAIRDFTYSHHLVAMIDQHSYGPYYSLPFGRPSLPGNTMSSTDNAFYTHVASAMGNYNGMRAGNSPQALGYEVAGGVKDWMLKGNIGTGTKGKIYGMTGEGGAGGGTGGSYGSFWAPAGEIENLCKGMTYQNLQLIYMTGSYVNLQDVGDINLVSKTGVFDFRATRIGLENRTVNISIVPMENIQAVGPPVAITTLVNYNDSHSGNIGYTLPAALPNGQRVRFAWKIETGGYTYYDTVTKFYNATQLLYDDMEGNFSTNWTSQATNASPFVTEEDWTFTTIDKFAGSKSMTESASGNYYERTTRTATYNNQFDLSDATAAYLSFWTRHRAENFRDRLRVQVSVNGTNWVSLPGTTTVQEPGSLDGSTINGTPALTGVKPEWTRELFDLGGYTGEPNLHFRFLFTSNSTGSFDFSEDDGFYIDNVKVIKSTSALITLPVQFISFTGKILPDQTVRLDWDAVTDEMHDYFEVERSNDGVIFNSIGRGPATAPYWKIDPTPLSGISFYRIKQIDKDGRITYSTVVSITYNHELGITVFPNPVSDVLNIKVNLPAPAQYTISLTDPSGKKVVERKLSGLPGGSIARIPLKQLAAQVYFLIVRNERNEIVASQKIMKE